MEAHVCSSLLLLIPGRGLTRWPWSCWESLVSCSKGPNDVYFLLQIWQAVYFMSAHRQYYYYENGNIFNENLYFISLTKNAYI